LSSRRPFEKLRSNLWDDASDEGSYDSKTVDDWGVNRDMQQSYKYVSFRIHRADVKCPSDPKQLE
jgi:hypothetical protein